MSSLDHPPPQILRSRCGTLTAAVVSTVLALLTGGCSAGYAGDVPIMYMPVSAGTAISLVQGSAESRIDIHSKSGIGKALFWVAGDAVSDDLTLRLHLRGLEQLTFTFGEHAIQAGVSSHGAQAVRQTVSIGDGDATPITPESPFWLKIAPSKIVDGHPVYFDVNPPPAFYDDSGAFRLRWIDFYR